MGLLVTIGKDTVGVSMTLEPLVNVGVTSVDDVAIV